MRNLSQTTIMRTLGGEGQLLGLFSDLSESDTTSPIVLRLLKLLINVLGDTDDQTMARFYCRIRLIDFLCAGLC